MQKGDISNKFNTLRNRNNDNDTGIYWLTKRMGKIRNLIIIGGFLAFSAYLYFWFKQHGDKLKTQCEKAYEQQFSGQVIKVFLEENSRGIVTVQLLNGNDTVEYFTGWGGHQNTGEHIRKGYRISKQANSFDLKIVGDSTTQQAVMELKATDTVCK